MILRALGVVTDQQRTFTCPRCKRVFTVVLIHIHGRNVLTGERFTGKVWQEPAKHLCSPTFEEQSTIIGSLF